MQFIHAVVCAIRCFCFYCSLPYFPPFSWVCLFLWDGLLGSGWLGNVAVSWEMWTERRKPEVGEKTLCLQVSEQIPAVLKLWSTFLVSNYELSTRNSATWWRAQTRHNRVRECLMSQLSWSMPLLYPTVSQNGWRLNLEKETPGLRP